MPVNEPITDPPQIPVVLTIAGSDNSGGAGIQADLKTFTTMGVFGTTAVTCIVAEHPGRVSGIESVSVHSVKEQIRLVCEAFPVKAMKTGMLYSQEIIEAVHEVLIDIDDQIPLVVDPVMVASSGAKLMQDEAIAALKKLLLPRATLVTPNRDEAMLLSGEVIKNHDDLRRVAQRLANQFGVPFLVKGGHLKEMAALDVLAIGKILHEFSEPMVPDVNPHGTGCTFSAAITASLAQGIPLISAVGLGKQFITRAIKNRFRIGSYDLLNQLPEHPYVDGASPYAPTCQGKGGHLPLSSQEKAGSN